MAERGPSKAKVAGSLPVPRSWRIKMDISYCTTCGNGYGFVDSPPAEQCFCGGDLIDETEIDEDSTFIKWGDINYPTVSC